MVKVVLVFGSTTGNTEVFIHHLQEYKKGLRTLVLHTTKASNRDAIEKRLKREKIDYYIQKVNETKINVFFGNSTCIEVIKQMNFASLSNLTDEEDFILGTMLGYDRVKQCERYLKRKRSSNTFYFYKKENLCLSKKLESLQNVL